MDLEQCRSYYLKAELLSEQGHWLEAYNLYDLLLTYLPDHVQSAVVEESTKPWRMMFILDRYRNASINLSNILSYMGKEDEAFQRLNQAYSFIQFLALESSPLLDAIKPVLNRHSEELLGKIVIFCTNKRSATWMFELKNIQETHYHFYQLKQRNTPQLTQFIN